MNAGDMAFLEGAFKRYYFGHHDLIHVPERAGEREFGYQKLGSGMIRHISIKDDRELRLLLMRNVPSDVYCSNACYLFPSLPMKEKDWQEADLIFDIDAKDLDLSCRPGHTASVCGGCNAVSMDPVECPRCGSARLDRRSLPCSRCIESSKGEVTKLLRILTDDLGIASNGIRVYFSGNEGFHVHVHDSQFQRIGARERADLVDYIAFNGAIPETFGMRRIRPAKGSFPALDDPGWRGRLARSLFGSKSNRLKVVSSLVKDPEKGYADLQRMLGDDSLGIGVSIDPNVTTDIHRVFRLPGSLNSKSGLAKIPCADLGGFDPYREAPLLGDEETGVTASCPVSFRLGGIRFGPYDNERIEVPAYAAAYMICKKLATTQ